MESAFDWPDRLRAIRLVEGDSTAEFLFWLLLHRRVYTDGEGSGFASLSDIERTLWRVGCLVGDVMNGGFDQFYFNSSGKFANQLPSDLELMGLPKMRALLQSANQILGKGKPVPADRARRQDALDRIVFWSKRRSRAAFAELDREFHALSCEERPSLLEFALSRAAELAYSRSEFDAALEKQPQLLFPRDRMAFGKFDTSDKTIAVEVDGSKHRIALADLRSLSIVKKGAAQGSSGLYYRLQLADDAIDVPYFARGESSHGTIIWFLDSMRSHPLVGFANSLAEARRSGPLEPILLWENVPGARYLE